MKKKPRYHKTYAVRNKVIPHIDGIMTDQVQDLFIRLMGDMTPALYYLHRPGYFGIKDSYDDNLHHVVASFWEATLVVRLKEQLKEVL